jgi:hypothetical protein
VSGEVQALVGEAVELTELRLAELGLRRVSANHYEWALAPGFAGRLTVGYTKRLQYQKVETGHLVGVRSAAVERIVKALTGSSSRKYPPDTASALLWNLLPRGEDVGFRAGTSLRVGQPVAPAVDEAMTAFAEVGMPWAARLADLGALRRHLMGLPGAGHDQHLEARRIAISLIFGDRAAAQRILDAVSAAWPEERIDPAGIRGLVAVWAAHLEEAAELAETGRSHAACGEVVASPS